MCEQTEINYLDGEVVWVKLGSCWWPGEVVGPEKLPPDVLPSFRKPPIAVVKFFQEDTYEYVKNINSIYKYNCSRKNEFINKGLYMYRTKHGPMEKFPEDIIRAETAVGGDIEILTRDEFQETKKESYAGLFGDAKKTPASVKKGRGRGRISESPRTATPIRKIMEKADYKVHILLQGSATPSKKSETEVSATPNANDVPVETLEESETVAKKGESPTPEISKNIEKSVPSITTTPTVSSSGIYSCHACSFSTARLNVLILHNKTHSVTFTPYTPTPIKKKVLKPIPKSTPTTSKSPKVSKQRKEKTEKALKKSGQTLKRANEQPRTPIDVKKPKTDQEIKSSLLADWDDVDDESNDDSPAMAASPEVPVAAESPAVPIPAELPSAQVPTETSLSVDKKSEDTVIEKSESTSDSKYEFCEDEDWPVEADAGRKIPRVKNPKRKEDIKSLSLDDEDVAREVAELLNKTTVPELPTVPEQLKVEENFPEPSIVKSPDKHTELEVGRAQEKPTAESQPTKAIFKTKTFFRSRHSRSQDAIGKYVAEQLNAVERMDMSENEINGSDNISSPEARDSPPIEQIKVARLAPKIQLKRMKAEAAQLRDKEKNDTEFLRDDISTVTATSSREILNLEKSSTESPQISEGNEITTSPQLLHEVLYPTHEIKPINEKVLKETKSLLNKEEILLPMPDIINEKTQSVNNKVSDGNEVNFAEPNSSRTDTTDFKSVGQVSSVLFDVKETKTSLDNISEKLEPPYMNESTASAVDALLSVSRDTDRVTKVISDDPPEDLFEDDNKDSGMNNINGFNENLNEKTEISTECHLELKGNCQEQVNLIETTINDNNVPDSEMIDVEPKEIIIYENDEDQIKNIEIESVHIENDEIRLKTVVENIPSESDLQIAEALINLPSTAIQNKSNEQLDNVSVLPNENIIVSETVLSDNSFYKTNKELNPSAVENPSPNEQTLVTGNDNINVRFETEQEKCENLNAAQSLVQMSESIDHTLNIVESNTLNTTDKPKQEAFSGKQNNGIDKIKTIEQNVASLSSDNNNELINCKPMKYETTSSKLLKILEEPCTPKIMKKTPTKQIIIPGKEKILNFDVAKSTLKGKSQSPVIIRRAPANTTLLNNLNDSNTSEKIILSPSGSSMQTYTIQTAPDVPSDSKKITIIQQKIKKIQKTPTKLQKIKPQNSLVTPISDSKIINEATVEDSIFDINSMPIVLSDDILTPESIEKMPIVMSDGNLITNTQNPPKLVKTKQAIIETEKPVINQSMNKPEVKTLLINPINEINKVTTTPNILSKSSKLRGAKPMLVIDKTTGKQKTIMTKSEPAIKEIKSAPTLLQPVPHNTAKPEKFIILPSAASTPRPGRTQKIVIDPQSGKAHMLVPQKGSDTLLNLNDNKPVSAKLIPSSSDASGPGSTVMIITNAQGAQSRIVLTSEHEKILFPNKQQPQQQNMSQQKTITHRITTNSTNTQKAVVTTVPQIKTQTRLVPKQKSAIITSKGQLIVGGRVTTTAQNIAPMPEIRPVAKRIIPAEPKKIVQTIQKSASEPLIFLQQKSGTVVQLTASQFEHFQRTGQIIQRISAPTENKPIIQKTITISPGDPVPTIVQKRIRKTVTESPTPAKKVKQEIPIAPAPPPAPITPMPALAPLASNVATTIGPSISNTVSVTTTSSYPDLENLEEMLPSTAIVRQPEAIAPQPEPTPPPAAPLSDGQLLAVPGEHFGGPPGSFYLCVKDCGTLTPIDNRPLVLENNQLVPMPAEPLPMIAPQPERRDILEAALANSDVFHADPPRDEAPDFRDLNANVSVHCRVSETSTTLNQPIMTPVEVPSKVDIEPTTVPSNLEDGLAVIGVTPHTVPTSLELPITVTDPRIAPKTTDPLSGTNYGTTLLQSPNTEMTFVTEDVDVPVGGPISMPLLTDDDPVGKSMPILTDEVAERTVSSVESADSPSSDVRSDPEEGGHWSRRLLTPSSDTSETSSEIPLQPAIQLSVNDMSRHS